MQKQLIGTMLTLVVVGCGTSAPTQENQTMTAVSAPTGPAGSNFWSVPLEALPSAQRGDVLWAGARADAPAGSEGWNIIYVSEGATGALVYVSGEVYVPNDIPDGSLERRLVIWNHGTAGTEDSCAPSRNNLTVAFTNPTDLLASDGESRVPALVSLLDRGYVVAMSDYQGLGTPGGTEYLNGPAQGMAALDVARAARNVVADVGTTVGMYGFSQGGQTSLWAAHLAPDYAPELDLVGVIATAPAARQLALSFYDLDIPENSGYFISRMAGLAVGRPDVSLRDMLTPAGLELLDAQTWDCYEIFRQAAGMTEPYAYPEALEPGTAWRTLLEANDAFLPINTSIPVLIVQGDADVDVGVELTRDVVQDLCTTGTIVEYQEYAEVNHMDMSIQAAPLMADWFDARFAGTPAPNTCAAD
jgi:pimeloyl-ACP methyl ester carboxylesterase